MNYQQRSLAGLNGIELIMALYDGMVRFLFRAVAAIEAGDVHERRRAVKRVFDILIHLQARLRMDVGGTPAKALSDFYTAMFALALQGSQEQAPARLLHAISCIRNVREAWQADRPRSGGAESNAAEFADNRGADQQCSVCPWSKVVRSATTGATADCRIHADGWLDESASTPAGLAIEISLQVRWLRASSSSSSCFWKRLA